MGLKRTITAVLSVLALLLPLMTLNAAAQDYFAFDIEQVQAEMPEISVYMRGIETPSDIKDAQIAATLDGEPLEAVDTGMAGDFSEGVGYLILVDCSTSITRWQMGEIKSALADFSGNLTAPDTMTLIAFGEDVKILLNGGEDAAQRLEAIESLESDQQGTILFEAVSRAVDLSETYHGTGNRSVMVLFTDAEDFTVGSVTYNELAGRLSAESLPIYAVGFDTGTKSSLDALGVLSRESGGGLLVTPLEKTRENFGACVEAVKSCVKLLLRAPTNEVGGPRGLSVTVTLGGETYTQERQIVPKRWQADSTVPEITRLEQSSANSLRIYFSKPVYGADRPENYLVSGNGAEYTVSQATYISAENAAALTLSQELEAGEYTVSCFNITDRSMEKNLVTGNPVFTIDPPPPEPQKKNLGWIPITAVAALIAAAVTAVVLISKSSGKDKKTVVSGDPNIPRQAAPARSAQPEPKHHFKAPNVEKLTLLVSDGGGAAHKVEVKVDGSLFVGSSSMCNLYFDDPRLAAQHFVIEAKDGGFFIQDLESPGGTFVNGVRVNGPRRLEDRDSISAGQETFVYFK